MSGNDKENAGNLEPLRSEVDHRCARTPTSRIPLMRLTLRRILIPLLVALAAVPVTASAAGRDVLRDCNDNGRLDKQYSQGDYADALKNIPTDLDEYTNCRDVIRRAQLGRASGSGGGGSSSGSGNPGATAGAAGAGGGGGTGGAIGELPAPSSSQSVTEEALATASPQEREALAEATVGGRSPVEIGGATIRPGDLGLSSSSTLPTPLVAALILLGVGALAGGGLAARQRVRAGRS